ncbi:hypothetical protein [Bradyrhizobium sp. Gha]|uniref:hypothetical protein n=1 Tax=Bradyrhizobium sp. Gha TaxID=1855318 RepID=UPI0008E5EEA4|nr:hypothetical protein [Bradyrhizobium sp. Gha]SFI41561.1 hypothetical protein SAMN05216525_108139 [Bradyrhizobium sp. Gha]
MLGLLTIIYGLNFIDRTIFILGGFVVANIRRRPPAITSGLAGPVSSRSPRPASARASAVRTIRAGIKRAS